MKRIILLSLVAIAILAGIIYQLYSNQQEITEAVAEEKKPIPFTIEAIAIVEKQFAESTIYRGQIQPFKTIQISTEANGRVAKVNFKKGDKVTKNQVLIQLDATILQANVAIQKANIAKLKKDADRLQALYEEKNVSIQELENIQIQLTTAVEQLKIAEKELANTISIAPINALASEKYVNEGEVLQSGSSVATLVDVSSVLAKIYLNEIDALHLKIGSSIKVKTKTYPNHVFAGKIENIIPIATEAKLYPAEIKIENTNSKFPLLAGMQIEVEVVSSNTPKTISIPRTAISGSFSEPSVFQIKDGEILKKAISLGALHGELIEVLEGIAIGDTVASLGLSNLENHMKSPKYTLVKY